MQQYPASFLIVVNCAHGPVLGFHLGLAAEAQEGDLIAGQESDSVLGFVGHGLQNSLLLQGGNELHAVLEFVASVTGECRMDISEVLQGAEDEPAGIIARSADGRLFFIPDVEAERFAIEGSELYTAFIAARGGTSPAKPNSLYPCVLAADWLGSHSPHSAKWRRICLEYFDNC
jgi:hypothetical protein